MERSRVQSPLAAPFNSLKSLTEAGRALPIPPRFEPEQGANVPQILGEIWGKAFSACSDEPPDPGNEKAAPDGPRSGSQNEKALGGAFDNLDTIAARVDAIAIRFDAFDLPDDALVALHFADWLAGDADGEPSLGALEFNGVAELYLGTVAGYPAWEANPNADQSGWGLTGADGREEDAGDEPEGPDPDLEPALGWTLAGDKGADAASRRGEDEPSLGWIGNGPRPNENGDDREEDRGEYDIARTEDEPIFPDTGPDERHHLIAALNWLASCRPAPRSARDEGNVVRPDAAVWGRRP